MRVVKYCSRCRCTAARERSCRGTGSRLHGCRWAAFGAVTAIATVTSTTAGSSSGDQRSTARGHSRYPLLCQLCQRSRAICPSTRAASPSTAIISLEGRIRSVAATRRGSREHAPTCPSAGVRSRPSTKRERIIDDDDLLVMQPPEDAFSNSRCTRRWRFPTPSPSHRHRRLPIGA